MDIKPAAELPVQLVTPAPLPQTALETRQLFEQAVTQRLVPPGLAQRGQVNDARTEALSGIVASLHAADGEARITVPQPPTLASTAVGSEVVSQTRLAAGDRPEDPAPLPDGVPPGWTQEWEARASYGRGDTRPATKLEGPDGHTDTAAAAAAAAAADVDADAEFIDAFFGGAKAPVRGLTVEAISCAPVAASEDVKRSELAPAEHEIAASADGRASIEIDSTQSLAHSGVSLTTEGTAALKPAPADPAKGKEESDAVALDSADPPIAARADERPARTEGDASTTKGDGERAPTEIDGTKSLLFSGVSLTTEGMAALKLRRRRLGLERSGPEIETQAQTKPAEKTAATKQSDKAELPGTVSPNPQALSAPPIPTVAAIAPVVQATAAARAGVLPSIQAGVAPLMATTAIGGTSPTVSPLASNAPKATQPNVETDADSLAAVGASGETRPDEETADIDGSSWPDDAMAPEQRRLMEQVQALAAAQQIQSTIVAVSQTAVANQPESLPLEVLKAL